MTIWDKAHLFPQCITEVCLNSFAFCSFATWIKRDNNANSIVLAESGTRRSLPFLVLVTSTFLLSRSILVSRRERSSSMRRPVSTSNSDNFYRFKELYEIGGEASIDGHQQEGAAYEEPCAGACGESSAVENPALGQLRTSQELQLRGYYGFLQRCAPGMVRHDLEMLKKRFKALEAKSAQEGILLTFPYRWYGPRGYGRRRVPEWHRSVRSPLSAFLSMLFNVKGDMLLVPPQRPSTASVSILLVYNLKLQQLGRKL